MGRPRKPVEDHLRNNTFRPGRGHALPDPDPGRPYRPPEKPRGLKGEAGRFWDRVVGLLGPIARDRDAAALELMAKLWAKGVRVDKALEAAAPGDKDYAPLMRVSGQVTDRLVKLLDRFGLTPRARLKLGVIDHAPPTQRVPVRPKTKLDLSGPPVGFEGTQDQ